MLAKEEQIASQGIIDEIFNMKDAELFRVPVDYKALSLLDYPTIIKNPMDLGTIKKKLKHSKYKTFAEFQDEIQLVWDNCKKYNLEGSNIYKQALKLEKVTKKIIKKWMPNYRDSVKKPKAGESGMYEEPSHRDVSPIQDPDGGKILFNQKVKFSQKIKRLSQDQLIKVVQMIWEGCPAAVKEVSKEKMQIKVDDLSSDVFKRIDQYVDYVLNNEESKD